MHLPWLNITLAASPQPVFTSPAIESFKALVNRLSDPMISLPILTLLFVVMLVSYRWWTRPLVAAGLLGAFCFVYFGSILIDPNYGLIIRKPDNVPITMMLLGVGFCLWMAFRGAALNDAALSQGRPMPVEDKDDKTLVWPDLVYTEMICLVLASAILVLWAVLLAAPLESPANPGGPPNPSKAPWYFLGLQELLVYFDPWMAGVLLPGLIVVGLIAMPYIDVNPRGNGYYTLRQRPFAIASWLFGFLILWVVLIVYGTFLRGPNWYFFGPYQYWDAHLSLPGTNINLSDYFWNGKKLLGFGLDHGLPGNMIVRELPGLIFVAFWLVALPVILARTVFRSMYQQMGLIRYAIMIMMLLIMAMVPLKMVLRWTLNLKYFIYLQEVNLNL
ncbi:MAG: hypothetical protein WD042_12830 [Phycisphaeraceae bacterium]